MKMSMLNIFLQKKINRNQILNNFNKYLLEK